jgi:hypothetical protein
MRFERREEERKREEEWRRNESENKRGYLQQKPWLMKYVRA